MGVRFQQDMLGRKKTNCKIWEAKMEDVGLNAECVFRENPSSLHRKAGGTALRLFCMELKGAVPAPLALWRVSRQGTGSQRAHAGRDPDRKQAGCEQVSSWQGQMGERLQSKAAGK